MTMDSMMATVNFIHSASSLQHCLFRMLLTEMFAGHHNLLLHNDIKWQSNSQSTGVFL